MQGLLSKSREGCLRRLGQAGRLGLEARAVDIVADQRMADMGHMDADLVRAAGLQPAVEQARDRLAVRSRRSVSSTCQWVIASRPPARTATLVARSRVAAERRVDGALRAVGRAPDEGQIAALQRPGAAMVGELGGQRLMGARRSWRRPSGRWCPCRADARCPAACTPPMPERLSPQWAISALTSVPVAVAGGGMHDQPGRLVDDDELVVLVDDVERDVLALRLGRLRPAARRPRLSRRH